MEDKDKKHIRKRYIRNIWISLILCATFFGIMFANFFGLAVYPGNTYKELEGKHYLLYVQKYHDCRQDDLLLVKDPARQQAQLTKASELSEQEDGQYEIVGKVLLYW